MAYGLKASSCHPLRTLHCRFRVNACFNSLAVSNKFYCPLLVGYQNQSVLTNCYNCSEVKWTIIHLLQQKVYCISLCFVYDKQRFHLEVKWAIPHSTFLFFFAFSQFLFIFHKYFHIK